MHRLILLLLLASVAWAQDSEQAEPEPPAETPEPAADTDAVEEDVDMLDDIELYPVEDEDEFIPSENVKFGQSIPFPTDI